MDRLAENSETTDHVELIANALGKEVLDELNRSVDEVHRVDRRRALADHFWCDLLAALAAALHELQHELGRVPDYASAAILAARDEHPARSAIEEQQVKLAVDQAWIAIKKMPFVATRLPNLEELLLATRVLAVMICPSPEDHREVVKHCVRPLLGEWIGHLAKQRLSHALPEKWLA